MKKEKKYELKYKSKQVYRNFRSAEEAVENFILLWEINENVVKKNITRT